MANLDDRPLDDLQDPYDPHGFHVRMERNDPRFARDVDSGGPCGPREYRHGSAWLFLVIALALLATGLLLPQGLVLAAGLVLAGVVVGQVFGALAGED